MKNLEVWYSGLEIEPLLQERAADLKPRAVERTQKTLDKARTRDSMSAFEKLTHVVDGQPRIVDESPLIVPLDKLVGDSERDRRSRRSVALSVRSGSRSSPIAACCSRSSCWPTSLARSSASVASARARGSRCSSAATGRTRCSCRSKRPTASVLEEPLGPSEFANHGERVVNGQRLMQASSDILLGWLRVEESPIDAKPRGLLRTPVEGLERLSRHRPAAAEGMAIYGRLCGWTLARAHARSGDRIAIAAYLGSGDVFDRATLEFSRAYAELNGQDYQRLADAVKSGRIKAQTGL